MDHFYFGIPGWFNFHDVYDRAVALLGRDGAHFVEVGCWEGRSAAYMGVSIVNSGKRIQFDCVDTWEGSAEHVDEVEKSGLWDRFRSNMDAHFTGVGLDIRAKRLESVKAAAEYEDGSLDFVFLDASHDVKSVYDDIQAWLPKISQRGVLAGDDVAWVGVRAALIKSGLGVAGRPLVMSGTTYKSWILAPAESARSWITPVPAATNNALVNGLEEFSAETLGNAFGYWEDNVA